MPLAFVAKGDEESAVADLWGEVWDEGTSSLSAALRMYMPDLVTLITQGAALCCAPSTALHPVSCAKYAT